MDHNASQPFTQPLDKDGMDQLGRYPIHCAARRGDLEIVKALVESKVNVDQPHASDAQTALVDAIFGDMGNGGSEARRVGDLLSTAMVGWLLKHKASANGVSSNGTPVSSNGTPALVLAIQRGTVDLVKALLEHKADPAMGQCMSGRDKGKSARQIAEFWRKFREAPSSGRPRTQIADLVIDRMAIAATPTAPPAPNPFGVGVAVAVAVAASSALG